MRGRSRTTPAREPARSTRSQSAGRPRRAASASNTAGKKTAKAPKSTAGKPQQAAKKKPSASATAHKRQTANEKPTSAKKQPKQQREQQEVDQPVEVVIQVKNQKINPAQNKKTNQQPAKKGGVVSGKVGKRKEKGVKKETLKKASSNQDKCENIVQVNVYTKVLPSPPKSETLHPKAKAAKATKKEKQEKKKPEKEIKKEKEIKVEHEEVEVKEEKTKKAPKKEVKIKKELKDDKEEKPIKEEKISNEEKETAVVKKKVVKPKNKSKEGNEPAKKAETKAKDVTEVEKSKVSKPKIKVEKLSPITVIEDEDGREESPERPTKVEVAEKIAKAKEEKAEKQPAVKKKDAPPKKKAQPRKSFKEPPPPVIEKRHREASLNALAKVHCLYENETRSAMNEMLDKSVMLKKKEEVKQEKKDDDSEKEEPEKSSRTLRQTPGMRGMGRYWDTTHLPSSSSSSPSSSSAEDEESEKQEEQEEEGEEKGKEPEKKARKRRKRCEVRMDLKDMVVTKRMASLNASAMMAASYSVEKRSRGSKSDDSSNSSTSIQSSDEEVLVSGASKKVAVIVNQDTDLTITGLYTTRSTRHEGYCSIAGMQYRISSTSHTQTEATAVSSETLIHTTDHVSLSHSESGGSEHAGTSSPGGSLKSYTPLGALSSMQPPGQGRPCGSSAFSAPPYHPHPQEIHGYYQPAGPLIQHSGKSASPEPPPPQPPPPQPTSYPPYPFPSPYPPPPAGHHDYSAYYSRGAVAYRRPWAPAPQLMTAADYHLEPPPPPPYHPAYYSPYPSHPPAPPPPPPPQPTAPPVCYGSPVRGMPFIEQGFQCPCPMQSACPKNVHTGPLTGASKRSEVEAQTDSAPLLPVALALPPESGVSPGPPSPARGSVGMPPSSSPALSTARNERWSPPAESEEDIKPLELTVVQQQPLPPQPAPVVSPPPAIAPVTPVTPPAPVTPTTPATKRQRKRPAKEATDVARKRKKTTAPVKAKSKGAKAVVPKEIEDNEKITINNNNIVEKVSKLFRIKPPLKLSNGWNWEGEPFTARVYRRTEDNGEMQKCYPAIRHDQGDIIRARDCILLRSGSKKHPFVAKVTAMWENPEDGEMMISVLWYYRPEHTEAGPSPDQPDDEVFASRHKDTNSVACIEDKCYVLTYHEYARYRKSLLAGPGTRCHTVVPPPPEGYPRAHLLPPGQVSPDLIFFCRQVYDFRLKKVLKKPPFQPPPRT